MDVGEVFWLSEGAVVRRVGVRGLEEEWLKFELERTAVGRGEMLEDEEEEEDRRGGD